MFLSLGQITMSYDLDFLFKDKLQQNVFKDAKANQLQLQQCAKRANVSLKPGYFFFLQK